MAKEYYAILGSGTVPNIGPYHPSLSGAFSNNRFPQPCDGNGKVFTRTGTGTIVLNYEDASIFLGLNAQAISVDTSATPLPASPIVGRRALAIHNSGPGILYIGYSNVTTAQGFPIAVDEKIALDIAGNPNVIVYGISESTSDVRILELA